MCELSSGLKILMRQNVFVPPMAYTVIKLNQVLKNCTFLVCNADAFTLNSGFLFSECVGRKFGEKTLNKMWFTIRTSCNQKGCNLLKKKIKLENIHLELYVTNL